MLLRVALVALSLTTFAACAGTPPPAKAHELRARDFVPLAVGHRWEYRVSSAPRDAPRDAVEIVEKDRHGFFIDSHGRKLAPRTDGVFDGVRFLLQEPVAAGHEWIAVPKDQPDAVERYRISAVGTSATVPAGTFHGCVEVEVTQGIRHGTTHERAVLKVTWVYAPGVGLVKTFGTLTPETSAPIATPTMELVSYKLSSVPSARQQ
jgi:hypothetical protein